jgi:hypothetical protein
MTWVVVGKYLPDNRTFLGRVPAVEKHQNPLVVSNDPKLQLDQFLLYRPKLQFMAGIFEHFFQLDFFVGEEVFETNFGIQHLHILGRKRYFAHKSNFSFFL